MQDTLNITIRQEVNRCLLCYDAPCSKACPAHNRPDKFIRALYFQNKIGAAKLMMDANLLSGICAQSCRQRAYCQGACIRGKIDKPIDVPMIQEYLARFAEQINYLPPIQAHNGKKVIILGGNTAGLAAAVRLTEYGADVVVYHFKSPAIEQNVQLASLRRIDNKNTEDAYSLVEKFGIDCRQISIAQLENIDQKHIDACIIASKEYSKWLQMKENKTRTFVTGELLSGPDSDTFAVRKGRETAGNVWKYLREMGEAQ